MPNAIILFYGPLPPTAVEEDDAPFIAQETTATSSNLAGKPNGPDVIIVTTGSPLT